MATMREIRRRKESIQSTEQITKAMKLVSTVKLQRSREKAEKTKTYFDAVYRTMGSILRRSHNILHPYLTRGGSPEKAVILISSNRGLAGGYNAGVVRLITELEDEKEHLRLYNIGLKGGEMLAGKGYRIEQDHSDVINAPLFSDASELAEEVLEAFRKGEVGEIWLGFTRFKNTVVHEPVLLRLLPVDPDAVRADAPEEEDREVPMNFEPSAEEVLGELIPKYISGLIYGALLEAVASENAARMQAMDTATGNADEMIAKLSLSYNRARQAAITQELTEIIAGAQAIE